MKRSGFKRAYQPREKSYSKPDVSLFRDAKKVSNEEFSPDAKPVAHRNSALLELAKGKPCIACMLIGVETCSPGSTVAAHSNLMRHGKAKGRKADDFYSVWLGFEHHQWLDQGSASAELKEQMFTACHEKQIDLWRVVEYSKHESERNKQAARWALSHLIKE